MFTVINIVGSLIVAFAVWYIKKEPVSEERQRRFIFYLTLFLSIMNLIIVGKENINIMYILIFFHAVSKALLFLLAGILEKHQHLKDISQMDGLLQRAPLSSMMIMLGFATITLPPFGLFAGNCFNTSFGH